MKFSETKEEKIQYIENDIKRLESEYRMYKRLCVIFAVCAILCLIIKFTLSVYDTFGNFLSIVGLIVFAIAFLVCLVQQAGYTENIAWRQSSLDLIKNDYEKYMKQGNQAIHESIQHLKAIESCDEIHSPKCPICGSYDLSPITPIQKAGKIFLWGVYAAGDMAKTWKCNNCGSKF